MIDDRPWDEDLGRHLEPDEMIDRPCPYGCGEHIEIPRYSVSPPPWPMPPMGELHMVCPRCRRALDVETGDPYEFPARRRRDN